MKVRRLKLMLPAALVLVALSVTGCTSTPADDNSDVHPDAGPPPKTELERAAQRLRPVTREQIEELQIGMAWGDVQMKLGQPDFLTTNVGPYLRAKEGGIYWLEFTGGAIWMTRAIYFPRGLTRGEIILPESERGKAVKVESISEAKPTR